MVRRITQVDLDSKKARKYILGELSQSISTGTGKKLHKKASLMMTANLAAGIRWKR